MATGINWRHRRQEEIFRILFKWIRHFLSQYQKKGQLVDLNQYIESGVIDTTNVPDSIMKSGGRSMEVILTPIVVAGTNAQKLLS